jgi:hypothetical protein
MTQKLSGTTALVTGASSGIGATRTRSSASTGVGSRRTVPSPWPTLSLGRGTAPSASAQTGSRRRPSHQSCAELDVARPHAVVRLDHPRAMDLRGDVVGNRAGGGLRKHTCPGNRSVGQSPSAYTFRKRVATFRGSTATQPSVPPTVSPDASTTAGARCTGMKTRKRRRRSDRPGRRAPGRPTTPAAGWPAPARRSPHPGSTRAASWEQHVAPIGSPHTTVGVRPSFTDCRARLRTCPSAR